MKETGKFSSLVKSESNENNGQGQAGKRKQKEEKSGQKCAPSLVCHF